MITDKDVKKLKETLVTKNEMKAGFKSVSDDIRTVIEMVGDISQKLTDTIERFDKKSAEHDEMLENHERRLDKVEDKVFPTV